MLDGKQVRGDRVLVYDCDGYFTAAGVAESSATVVESYSDEAQEVAVDAVVLVTQRNSDNALYHDLRAHPAARAASGVAAVYQVGDCVLPSLIAEAVFNGHRLAREIDSPNPAVALPYIRERRLLNATETDYRLPDRVLPTVA